MEGAFVLMARSIRTASSLKNHLPVRNFSSGLPGDRLPAFKRLLETLSFTNKPILDGESGGLAPTRHTITLPVSQKLIHRRQMIPFGTAASLAIEDMDEHCHFQEEDYNVCPARLLEYIRSSLGVNFFAGVPDSCIKTFCAEIDQTSNREGSETSHAIAANEGAAIALAAGNYMATGRIPLVYMQNSGLGNAGNPLLSAAHPEVYGIPMILIIGWRGSPGEHDEPQHIVSGRQTEALLNALDVVTFILPKYDYGAKETLQAAHDTAKELNRPVAVLVRPKTFSGQVPSNLSSKPSLAREEALSLILDAVGPSDAVVATTGFTSRELYELREAAGESHASDFLCVGSMGHAISIAQGIAIAQPERIVWCIDGDGAALMHLGSMALSKAFGLSNLRHLLINNEAHESVGGQKTTASQRSIVGDELALSFVDLASSAGYRCMGAATTRSALVAKLTGFARDSIDSPSFLEVKVSVGARLDLGRPKISTASMKKAFMEFCKKPPLASARDKARTGFAASGDPLLLTPGPLTTSGTLKLSMLHDYGSRDRSFIELTSRVREQLVSVIQGMTDDLTAVLLQGSGTFAVEAMITQFVPPESGKVIILCNGAYGRRIADICKVGGRTFTIFEFAENEPLDVDKVCRALECQPDATHVAVVSCETTTGVLNPLPEIADAVSSRGMRLLVDAMSSFGVVDLQAELPFDAIAASSNKGLQGSPGLGFVIARKSALVKSAVYSNTLSLDLYNQWRSFETSGEWRFTPPTHCLLALAKALDEFEAEGGTQGRRKRYEANCKMLVEGMRRLGFETIIPDDSQAPVIVTFRMPTNSRFEFQKFYDHLSSKGYIIYPGKVTLEPSFRIGCIGHVFPGDINGFLGAVKSTLEEMEVILIR